MVTQLDLKEMERKAFRSTYQDGLWDIYVGGVLVGITVLTGIPESADFPVARFLAAFTVIGLSYLIFWAGKKYITLPRLGQVKFGAERRKRKRTLAAVLTVIVAIQAGVVLLSVALWANPELAARAPFLTASQSASDLLVASLGALFVGPSMAVVAYFNDHPRGYYIAVILSVAVFLMIWTGNPAYMLAAAALVILPGLVLFVRFLRQHPRPPAEALHA